MSCYWVHGHLQQVLLLALLADFSTCKKQASVGANADVQHACGDV